MARRHSTNWTARALGAGLGLSAGAYAGYVAASWFRYGHVEAPESEEQDPLLDRFMPDYDVVERHSLRVPAPPQ